MQKALILLICLLALCAAQESQLSYLSQAEAGSKTTDQLISAFANQQDEIIRKVFGHFIEEQVRRWRKSAIGDPLIREKVLGIVLGRSQDLYLSLKKFVEEKLFAKLDMHLLVQSLQKEIRLNPENYYLTFEVYDLLID